MDFNLYNKIRDEIRFQFLCLIRNPKIWVPPNLNSNFPIDSTLNDLKQALSCLFRRSAICFKNTLCWSSLAQDTLLLSNTDLNSFNRLGVRFLGIRKTLERLTVKIERKNKTCSSLSDQISNLKHKRKITF